MTNHLPALARQLAERLLATEDAIDTALSEAANLTQFMPLARKQARVSASFGHEALEDTLAALNALGEARRRMVRVHKSLVGSQAGVGLREKNYGGFIDKPQHRSELSVVDMGKRTG